eukprot:g19127.t1
MGRFVAQLVLLLAVLIGVASAQTTCAGGIAGVPGTTSDGVDVCCTEGCSQCGGTGCAGSTPGLSANDCCTSRISDAGEVCGEAPCILPPTCSSGIFGVPTTLNSGIEVCCDPGCVQCGGARCGASSPGLGVASCCTSRILDSGLVCGQDGGTVEAPCMIATECDIDDDCPLTDQICCPTKKVCEFPVDDDLTACGDPHMTGFLGQKFDFTGFDGDWYALFSSPPSIHVNMRVSTPLPELPIITYITGLSVLATDSDNVDHSIVIQVKDPSSLDSACPAGVSPCLANGALSVLLDGEETLVSPGTVEMAPGVTVSAVNLPGACRSFGFEKYWEQKQLEYAQIGRRLDQSSQTMADWILGDPTATNPAECAEYIAHAITDVSGGSGGDNGVDESGLFSHQSEHASFKIVTPQATIRLTHGKLHQIPMRDPTDTMDLPDHMTWQMNVAIDSNTRDSVVDADGSVIPAAKGILGETSVPTVDEDGEPIMDGMESIRGTTEEYRVDGPLSVVFDMDHEW